MNNEAIIITAIVIAFIILGSVVRYFISTESGLNKSEESFQTGWILIIIAIIGFINLF